MAKPVRTKNKDNARRAKKKVSLLLTERVEYVDWKDVNLLRRFMSDRAKIRARRVTGNSTQQQAEIARAIKNAREMALLPYASRVTQTRGPKRDGERGGRRERDLPAPDTEPMSSAPTTYVEDGSATRAPTLVEETVGAVASRRQGGGRVVKLVLRSDVAQVGKKGDIVDVSDGYGRNFLLPKGLAFVASDGVEAQAAKMRQSRDVRDASDRAAAQEVATSLVPKVVTITATGRCRGQALRLRVHRRDRRRGGRADRRHHRPPPAPPRRADQDGRHAPRAGQAPRRGRVPDHRRGRRLLDGSSPGPRTTRSPASTRPGRRELSTGLSTARTPRSPGFPQRCASGSPQGRRAASCDVAPARHRCS